MFNFKFQRKLCCFRQVASDIRTHTRLILFTKILIYRYVLYISVYVHSARGNENLHMCMFCQFSKGERLRVHISNVCCSRRRQHRVHVLIIMYTRASDAKCIRFYTIRMSLAEVAGRSAAPDTICHTPHTHIL